MRHVLKLLLSATLLSLLNFAQPANASPTYWGEWTFDDCTATDVSGNGHNGTIQGTQCIDHDLGKSLLFENSSNAGYFDKKDLVTLPNFTGSAVTFSARVKWRQASNFDPNATIWSIGDNNEPNWLGLRVDSNTGRIWLDYGTITTYNSYASIADGNWHKIYVTVDGNIGYFYLDDVLIGTATAPQPIAFNNSPHYLAYHQWYSGAGGSSRFYGELDDVGVLNTFAMADSNGVCGFANGATVSTVPTTNLCSSGIPGSVSGSGPWSWSCSGTGAGTAASCTANYALSGISISPEVALLNNPTVFTITGTNLGYGLGFAIADCEGTSREVGVGTLTSRSYICTPRASGSKSIVIKDAPGGTVLASDVITVVDQDTSIQQNIMISGYVTDGVEPIAGAMIKGTNGAACMTFSDSGGYYSCAVPAGWTGSIAAFSGAYSFSPSISAFTSISSQQTVDFTGEATQGISINSSSCIGAAENIAQYMNVANPTCEQMRGYSLYLNIIATELSNRTELYDEYINLTDKYHKIIKEKFEKANKIVDAIGFTVNFGRMGIWGEWQAHLVDIYKQALALPVNQIGDATAATALSSTWLGWALDAAAPTIESLLTKGVYKPSLIDYAGLAVKFAQVAETGRAAYRFREQAQDMGSLAIVRHILSNYYRNGMVVLMPTQTAADQLGLDLYDDALINSMLSSFDTDMRYYLSKYRDIDTLAMQNTPTNIIQDYGTGVTTTSGSVITVHAATQVSPQSGMTVDMGNSPIVGTTINISAGTYDNGPVTIKIGNERLDFSATGNVAVTAMPIQMADGSVKSILTVDAGSAGNANLTINARGLLPWDVLFAISNPDTLKVTTLYATEFSATVNVFTADSGPGVSASYVSVAQGSVRIPISINGVTRKHQRATRASSISQEYVEVLAGETAVIDENGELIKVMLGTGKTTGSAAGDPISPSVTGMSLPTVPRLSANSNRLGKAVDQAIAEVVGAELMYSQDGNGVLPLAFSDYRIYALPLGEVIIDATQPNGATQNADGTITITTQGISVRFAPLPGSPTQFARDVLAAFPGSSIEVAPNGTLIATIDNNRFALRADWLSSLGTGDPGFFPNEDGSLLYRFVGRNYRLYPAFADFSSFAASILELLPDATVIANADGTVTVTHEGNQWVIRPDISEIM